MCGITGFIGNFSKQTLQNMNSAIAHRGHDGEGVWLDERGLAGLGHRRLSIIDLSSAASQPMHAVNDRYVVTFNGEIYNFNHLAIELEEQGYSFNLNSDTAILAPLYDLYGEKMLEKLSGIFAFAIWDKQEQTLFAARDHFGIKPFYYTKTPDGLAFASEIKALLHVENLDKSIDENALFSYISYLWCPGEPTMLKGVRKLLPGHYLTACKGHIKIKKWYSPPLPKIENGKPVYDYNKTPTDLLNLLDEVVEEQMVADVQVGTFLSGGVDSSAIAASIKAHDNRPLEGFCMKFEDATMKKEGFSEDIAFAREVSDMHDINLNEVLVDNTCLNGLEEMVWYLDEPQADPAPLYVKIISKAAREKGIKVMMSGTGGDDIFTGYRRHQAINAMHKMRFIPKPLQVLGSLAVKTIAHGPLKRRLEKLHYMLSTGIEESLINSYHYTTPNTLFSILTPDFRKKLANRTADHLENIVELSQGQHPVNRQLYLEAHGFMPDHNLNYTDKLGMAEGIEIRVPFLDPKLIDFAHDLPLSQKIKAGETKYILKKSQETRLPHDVLYRSKAGFGAPMRQWLTGHASDMVNDILLSTNCTQRGIFDINGVKQLIADTKTGKVDGAYTILSLMVIELWFKQFIDNKAEVKITNKVANGGF